MNHLWTALLISLLLFYSRPTVTPGNFIVWDARCLHINADTKLEAPMLSNGQPDRTNMRIYHLDYKEDCAHIEVNRNANLLPK